MDVKISNAFLKVAVIGLGALMLALVIYGLFARRAYEKQLLDMSNSLAERDKTIEVQKGVYDKLTVQNREVEDLLTSKDTEIVQLKADLDKAHQDLLTATNLVVQWKKAYEAVVASTQTTVPSDGTHGERVKVSFTKDFGYIGTEGYCLTNPPETYIKIQQNRPLKLTVAIAQDQDKVWHTYTTSSEDNVGVDIQLTGVDPWMMDPKWYSRIGVSTLLALGSNPSGMAALAGVGLTLDIGNVSVGPSVMVSLANETTKYVGGSLIWRPFK